MNGRRGVLRLYVVRSGDYYRFAGSPPHPGVPLTQIGEAQVEALAGRLQDALPSREEPVVVLGSDMFWSQQTAAWVAQCLGVCTYNEAWLRFGASSRNLLWTRLLAIPAQTAVLCGHAQLVVDLLKLAGLMVGPVPHGLIYAFDFDLDEGSLVFCPQASDNPAYVV